MGLRNAALLTGFVLAVAACVPDPKSFETEPVVINTSAGAVTCQLYTAEIVALDRAINRPQGMSVAEADGICQAEGRRQAMRGRAAP
jgi:hypothetical protein